MTAIPLPTSGWREGDYAMLALCEGRLEQSSSGELTVVPWDGSTTDGELIVWPAGFTAEAPPEGPVRVLDGAGRVVLEVGDRFRVGGGSVVWSGPEHPEGVDALVMNGWPTRIPEAAGRQAEPTRRWNESPSDVSSDPA